MNARCTRRSVPLRRNDRGDLIVRVLHDVLANAREAVLGGSAGVPVGPRQDEVVLRDRAALPRDAELDRWEISTGPRRACRRWIACEARTGAPWLSLPLPSTREGELSRGRRLKSMSDPCWTLRYLHRCVHISMCALTRGSGPAVGGDVDRSSLLARLPSLNGCKGRVGAYIQ